MNIVVLAGGLSPERDVSLSSGVMIANALIQCGHSVALIDLFMGSDSFSDPKDAFRSSGTFAPYSVPETAPDLDAVRASRPSGFSGSVGNGVLELCGYADITYLALHGGNGENGSLQAFFDILGIRYTGSPSFGCSLAMDKWVSKQLFAGAGILCPKGVLLKKGDPIPDFPLPCVVKPCCGGSSLGISIARTQKEFQEALQTAFLYENTILLEEYIKGRELTCGILGDLLLPPTEIIPHEGFYDYAHKYQAGWTDEITPADIDKNTLDEVHRLTKKAFEALHLAVYSRVDFLLTEGGKLYCIEANTLPGMTPTSLLPQGAAEAGIDYPSLCERIIRLSLDK